MAKQRTKFFAAIVAAGLGVVLMTSLQAAERPRGVDHYLCYEPSAFSGHAAVKVKFRDQFGAGDGIVIRPVRLCNPVDKNGEGIVNKEAHLVCYYFDLQNMPDARERTVLTANQFGKTKMVVAKPNMICVPSRKEILK